MPHRPGISIKCIALAVALGTPSIAGASSSNCLASRDYLLGGLAGDLPQTPQSYKSLFEVCAGTVDLFNVKDAFLLRDGAIGVIAKRDGIGVTATTLSEFCQRFPKSTLRFITPKEQAKIKTVAQTVQLSSTSSTPCRKILGQPDR